jgi:hypothetical protein
LLWKDGVASLTEHIAKFKEGTCLPLWWCCYKMREISYLLEEVLGRNAYLKDMHQVFPVMFAYWVWLKQGWVHDDAMAHKGAHSTVNETVLHDLLRLWPCEAGQVVRNVLCLKCIFTPSHLGCFLGPYMQTHDLWMFL